MYTCRQCPFSIGADVWKIASSESGVPTAKRLLAAPAVSGAGARASRSALVAVMTARSDANTITRRCDDPCRDLLLLPALALRDFLATCFAAVLKRVVPDTGVAVHARRCVR